MAKNRRVLSSNSRLKKKKTKLSKKSSSHGGAGGSSSSDGNAGGIKKAVKLRFKTVKGTKKKFVSRASKIENMNRQRSILRKQQAAERMVLKEHLRDLEQRRQRIRKGENAKVERRELGKYIRQLKEEQQKKHTTDLKSLEEELMRVTAARDALLATGATDEAEWEEVEGEIAGDGQLEHIDEDELQNMFAHLLA